MKKVKAALSESTPVQIGLVLIVLAGFASGIWWAASISSKLDTVLRFQQSQEVQLGMMRTDVDGLRRDFEVHKASTLRGNP